MTEKLTAAEQAFEKSARETQQMILAGIAADLGVQTSIIVAALRAADARATERTARRCVEICRIHWDEEAIARAIAKEFGLD